MSAKVLSEDEIAEIRTRPVMRLDQLYVLDSHEELRRQLAEVTRERDEMIEPFGLGKAFGFRPDIMAAEIMKLQTKLATVTAERDVMREALLAICDYPGGGGYPREVVYDEFAYERMCDTYREVARRALAGSRGKVGG